MQQHYRLKAEDNLMRIADLLLADANLDTGGMTVYDMTMGTSQMLSCMEERIHDQKCSAIDELFAKKEQYLSEIENYKKS